MYKELPKERLIEEIKKHNVNYEIKVTDLNNKLIKVHKDDIDEIDLDNVKSVEFFIKKDYGLHLALIKVI